MVNLAVAGEENDGYTIGRSDEIFLQIHPAQTGHTYVEDDAPYTVVLLSCHKLLCRCSKSLP